MGALDAQSAIAQEKEIREQHWLHLSLRHPVSPGNPL